MRCEVKGIFEIVKEKGLEYKLLSPAVDYLRPSIARFTNLSEFKFDRSEYLESQYKNRKISVDPCICVDLCDAIVLLDGTIIVDGCIVKDTVPGVVVKQRQRYKLLSPVDSDAWEVNLSGIVNSPVEFAVCTTRYGIQYYGHWLAEILPRLYAARSEIPPNASILMPANFASPHDGQPSGMWKAIQQSLELAGIAYGSVISLPEGGMRIPRLRYVTKMGPTDRKAPAIFECFRELSGRLGARTSGRRIYVTRHDVADRRVHNEDEVMSLLGKHGFEYIRVSEYDFSGQVELFSSASVIAGPLGSALTNIAFARSGTAILPMIPAHWDDMFFYDLAALGGMCWYEVRGPLSTNVHRLYHRNDFEVDLPTLQRALALIEEDSDRAKPVRSRGPYPLPAQI
ncbi:glycosyltransferase family 61 protein [Paraburkholderia caffeinilytica]|uniref:glycosyltransferase family 61 protein n=1 Tax=Paraburkholderia caffeinilytica TaxID=1761016 RepID=UPI0038BD908E